MGTENQGAIDEMLSDMNRQISENFNSVIDQLVAASVDLSQIGTVRAKLVEAGRASN